MNDALLRLILDLVEWVAEKLRLTAWGEAVDRDLVVRRFVPGAEAFVEASLRSRDALAAEAHF